MKKIKISYNKESKLIKELIKRENIEVLDKKSLFAKLFSKKEYADIYFHFGAIENEVIEQLESAKKVIVNSNTMMHKLIVQAKLQDTSIIDVIYPSIELDYKKPKEIKEALAKNLGFAKDKKIILFTAKSFESSGIKEFLDILSYLKNDNYVVLIAGDKKQTSYIKFKKPNLEKDKRYFILEDYENIDDLFLVADIFLLPTHKNYFSYDILKAMFCKCAVFTPSQNHSSELLDIFATLDEPSDASTYFKIDALLNNENDLKLIKKQNRQKALDMTMDKNIAKFEKIVQNLNLT